MMTLRAGSTLTLDEVRDAVAEAVEADGRSHAEIQRALGLRGRGILARALDPESGTRYVKTLISALVLLRGYSAEPETRYRLVRASGE